MGIRIEWDNEEKTIMRHIYEDRWTLEEYYEHIEKNYEMIDAVGHKVYIINDLRKMTGMPDDVTEAIRYAAKRTHPDEALNIRLGASMYVTLLIERIYKVVGNPLVRMQLVNSIEEAYQIIKADMKKQEMEHGHSD